jgi:flagellar biosynthetic protein FliR
VPSLLSHLEPFLLVVFRLSGLLIFAPILSSPLIPARARIMLIMMFALALYPSLNLAPPRPVESITLFTLAPMVVAETLIGLTIGLLAALPMYAVQLGGQVIGQQIGLGLAGIYNPALDTEADVIGQLLMFIALAIFTAIGGLEWTFLALAATFTHLPPGAAVTTLPPLDLMVGIVSSGFEMALRVAAPVLCIILLETIASAFLMKTLPQLNIMSLGFGIKVLLAVIVLVWSIGAISEAIGHDITDTLRAVSAWAVPDTAPASPP